MIAISPSLLAFTSLVVTLISVISTYHLQRDKKKIRELEKENRFLKNRLRESLEAIRGYHHIERSLANKEGISEKHYRTKIRESELANEYNFFTPSKLRECEAIV